MQGGPQGGPAGVQGGLWPLVVFGMPNPLAEQVKVTLGGRWVREGYLVRSFG